jgi:uncharacterized protein YbjT (DUF2867 family)/uncharacterized protein YndB with AHSA1/START domain
MKKTMMNEAKLQPPVLVLGATGYVGARLVPELLRRGLRVRAGVRFPAKIARRPFADHPGFTTVQADVLDLASLLRAARGCCAAYYLVHSMRSRPGDFAAADRRAAENAVFAFEQAGLSRVIYLGGLGEAGDDLSRHLRSRREVGEILARGKTPLTWLRAAMILGSGSASFEILRYLADRMPVMIAPRWVKSACQPIAVSNVVDYLAGCLGNPATAGLALDIGGPDVFSYAELFQLYAEVAGLPKRRIITMPFFSPALSAYWISLITPVPAGLARPLVEGLRNTVICRDNRIRELVPVRLLSCREAITLALDNIRRCQVDSCWHGAGLARVPEWASCGDAEYAGGGVRECNYQIVLDAPLETVWFAVEAIGGEGGWYFGDVLWAVRGMVDKILGGAGHGRGRRHPEELHLGEALGLWRVAAIEPPERLLLAAEMRLPGQALLEFVLEAAEGGTRLRLSAQFAPRGLAGLAYWYAMAPFHAPLFRGMLRGLARRLGARILSGPEPFAWEAGACDATETPPE